MLNDFKDQSHVKKSTKKEKILRQREGGTQGKTKRKRKTFIEEVSSVKKEKEICFGIYVMGISIIIPRTSLGLP